ncbi:MAG: hypothetical protein BGO55_32215 [Sphingobacteriales bacterium 50-39]|nr:MAG: hypothetical protein BGO55_32215 [Sphingobacteriales bacterium 50-39]
MPRRRAAIPRPSVEVVTAAPVVSLQAMDCPGVQEERPQALHQEAPVYLVYNQVLFQDYGPEQAFPEDCPELFF